MSALGVAVDAINAVLGVAGIGIGVKGHLMQK